MLITIEGIDGCGKTTFAKNLVKALELEGRSVLHIREPGGTKFAEELRTILLQSDTSPMSDMLLLFSGRVDNIINKILPALATGTIVVSERFMDSTYAYQVAPDFTGTMEPIFDQLEVTCNNLLDNQPYRTIYLDTDLDTARSRMDGRGHDKFEIDPNTNVRVKLALDTRYGNDFSRFLHIDGNLSLEELDRHIAEIVVPLLTHDLEA